MPATTNVGFIEVRIAKVVGFGPPLAERDFHCVVLDELSGTRQVVIDVGEAEAFWLAATLQDLEFARPMTYHFAAALLGSLGGRVREVRVDRLVEGAYAATVDVEGPRGVQSVDARASDALNLAALTRAPVFVSSQVADDSDRRQDGGSVEARLLRLAPTVPLMRITRESPRPPALPASATRCLGGRGRPGSDLPVRRSAARLEYPRVTASAQNRPADRTRNGHVACGRARRGAGRFLW
jgi:bifunctional DNase/RNase